MAKRKSYKPQAAATEQGPSAEERAFGAAVAGVSAEGPDAEPGATGGADVDVAGSATARKDPRPASRRAAVKSYKPGSGARRGSGVTKFRRVLPVLVLAVCAVAFVAMVPMGSISAFGWESVSAICPLGALATLLASKTFVPRVVVSLVIALALIVLFGRAFCSWVCSVPLVERLLGLRHGDREGTHAHKAKAAPAAGACGGSACSSCAGACARQRGRALDTRHWVLGGSLLSAAVFGFPVFCLICPIGLTFATIYLVLRLFTGSVSWALPVVVALLLAELLLARRWCHRFCPLGALMSLVARANRTFVPTIDKSACLETTRSLSCGRCARSCPEGIDLRNLAASPVAINECVKCRACVEACPAHAISMPLAPRRGAAPTLAASEGVREDA